MNKVIATVLLAAVPAAAQSVVNGGFETGSFAPWAVVPTANGTSVATIITPYDIDGPGGWPVSSAASFCVGRTGPGAGPGGVTISQTLQDQSGGELRVWVYWSVRAFVNIHNSSGGLFELLVDGEVIGQASAPITVAGQSSYGFIFGNVTVPVGDHSVGVRITRTVPAGEEVFQYIDNIVVAPACYPNCDGSTSSPRLTANDFQCYLNKFAAGLSYANCDGTTGTPSLTASDFQCFLNQYAAGCS